MVFEQQMEDTEGAPKRVDVVKAVVCVRGTTSTCDAVEGEDFLTPVSAITSSGLFNDTPLATSTGDFEAVTASRAVVRSWICIVV